MTAKQPEQAPLFTPQFMAFYDPLGDFAPDEHGALLTWLSEGRSDAPDLAEQVHAGARTVAREMVHSMLITPNDFTNARGLGIDDAELAEIVERTTFDAQDTVQSVRKAVELLKEKHPDIANLAREQDPQEVVLHGAMLSVLSHRYQAKRVNGAEYSEHPKAAAAIVDIATVRANRYRRLPPEDLAYKNLTEYICYRHDGALEDLMSSEEGKRNRSFLREDGQDFTPLVDYLLLKELGVEEPVSYYVATGLRRITKTVGYRGRRGWEPYIEELSRPAPEAPDTFEGLVSLAKQAEMYHNSRIDKKLPPRRQKNESEEQYKKRLDKHVRKTEDYDWAHGVLGEYLTEALGFPTLVSAKIRTVTRAELRDYMGRQDKLIARLGRKLLLRTYDKSRTAA
ncbi:hypothetical protein KDA14_01375 [Candidatus Saccharibacteria bacterium]|nr:hypothetical protein [Candidatus Saccharibacteria bacterium]